MIAQKVSENVYLLDTMALGQANTVAAYLLKGKKTALVDCGYASSSSAILHGLAELGVSPSEVDYVIPTHVHLDHAGGAGHLLKDMSRARVLAQEKGVPHLVDPSRLIKSATEVFGEEIIRRYGAPVGVDANRIEPVREEMHLDLGGLSITMINAPGHAPHQLSVFVEEEKLLLTADAVGIVFPAVKTMIPTTPPPSLDPILLGQTTEKLEQLDSRALLVPHYGVRMDTHDVLETTRRKTEEWVSKVRTMHRAGAPAEGITRELASEVRASAGVGETELPPYAQLSIKISVNGILHHLGKTGQTKP